MFCRCQSGYLFRNPQETTHTVALAQWFGQSPFIFRQLLHSKNTSYKVWKEFYTSGRKEVKEGLYFSLEREETKTSHREVYIFKMYLFYQPHACKSNIPLKNIVQKEIFWEHTGSSFIYCHYYKTSLKGWASDAVSLLIWLRDCLPGHSYFMSLKTPCWAQPTTSAPLVLCEPSN